MSDVEDGPNDAEQEYGLIVHSAGEPQHALASFVRLMLNYQYGLGVLVGRNLSEATSLLIEHGHAIRCAFLVLDQETDSLQVVGALGRKGKLPVFILCPDHLVAAYESQLSESLNVFVCAWQKVFNQSGPSLQQIADQAFCQNDIETLYDERRHDLLGGGVNKRVSTMLQNMNTLPTLPIIVLRIMRLVNDPKSTVEALEKLLISDPAVVHKLVQVVNSPFFAGEGHKGRWTLKEAIVRLGRREMGTIAQQIKLINSFVKPQGSGFDLRRFWIHSVGCAVIADRLYTDKLLPFKAKLEFNDYWTTALLHDIGKLILGCFFWNYFDEVGKCLGDADSPARDFRQAEAHLGAVVNHEYIGRLLLMKGKMDKGLIEAVATHHSGGQSPRPLVCLIHVANNLAKDLGLGYFPEAQGGYDDRVLRSFHLRQKDLPKLTDSLGDSTLKDINTLVDQCLSN